MKKNNTQQVMIPVLIDRDSIKEYGYIAGMENYKIRKFKICNRILDVILVPGTKELYDTMMADYSRAFKAEDRDKRCAVPGKNGKLIRCPDTRKCNECPYFHEHKGKSTIPFSALATKVNDEDVLEYDAEAPENYYSGDREVRLLEDLIRYVSEKKPAYGTMIKLLYDGKSRRQVAEEMNLPKSTVIDCVKKIRNITEEFLNNVPY